jgi:glycosyltransferase involved in cell wall biosynthesis/Ser/Thr protein kinase RdoA (MazF antagonist)
MSRFPLLTETFILREMLELERQGTRVRIFPLLRTDAPVRHAETERLMPQVHYTPFLSRAICAANFHFLRRTPLRYVKLVWSVLTGTLGSRNLFFGALGTFPKSVYFARLVEREGIRHVHAHYATHPALAAFVISELTGATYSFTAHAHDIFVHQRMLRQKIERAHFVVAISEFNRQYLLRRAPRVAADKIKVVHCGIEPEKYGTTTAKDARPDAEHDGERGALDGRDKQFTILCVASLQTYKGIRYLIESCHLLAGHLSSNFRCLVVGEGVERARLESLIDELEMRERVQLLGARTQREVASLLAGADLFVLPSTVAPDGQMEGIPVALMEAMASGLPVVATRISGIPELVEDGINGRLVPHADAQALADAIISLYKSEAMRREMGERGREKVTAEFGLRENVAKLRALFQAATEREIQTKTVREAETSLTYSHRAVEAPRDALSTEFKEQVAKRAARFFADPNDAATEGAAHISFTRRGGGHDSEVYELASPHHYRVPERGAILKLHRPGRAQPAQAVEAGRSFAQNEYAALELLWREFTRRTARLNVPQPLAHLPEHAALLMEKCAGERLDGALRWSRLRKNREAREQLLRVVEACGEWLATFHEITKRAGSPVEIYERIERDFRDELVTCRELGLEAQLTSRIAQQFEQRKAAVFNGEHEIVGRHCDFAPYNVIFSGERVAVIDFEGFARGIVYDDLCYFLGMLETMPRYHLSSEMSQRARENFLKGYGRSGSTNAVHLDFFMLATMTKIMAHSPLLRPVGRQGWREQLKRWQRLKFFTGWFSKRVC